MSDTAHAFAVAVRAARKRNSLTQLALAEKAELSLDVVSAIEREVNVPTIVTAAKLIHALGIDAGTVFKGGPSARAVTTRRRDSEAEVVRVMEGLDDRGLALLLKLAAAVAEAHPVAPPSSDPLG